MCRTRTNKRNKKEMTDDDIKEINNQTREALYILKTVTIKSQEELKEEIGAIIYKAYATGKEAI